MGFTSTQKKIKKKEHEIVCSLSSSAVCLWGDTNWNNPVCSGVAVDGVKCQCSWFTVFNDFFFLEEADMSRALFWSCLSIANPSCSPSGQSHTYFTSSEKFHCTFHRQPFRTCHHFTSWKSELFHYFTFLIVDFNIYSSSEVSAVCSLSFRGFVFTLCSSLLIHRIIPHCQRCFPCQTVTFPWRKSQGISALL